MPLQNIPILLNMQGDWALLFVRLALGSILIFHGYPKLKNFTNTIAWFGSIGFRPGWLWGTVAAVVEFIGGLALVGGVLVRLAALAVLGQFIVIIGWHLVRRDKFKAYELDLMALTAAGVLTVFGGGAFIVLQILGF